jgi:2-methylisocitrate lyase-like PEP mutase family enzyme
MPSQSDKAAELLRLHSCGKLLLLPNIWDPIGARMLRAHGYPAVATASAALSAALGYQDGEKIQRSTLIEQLRRIAGSVDVPVTADIEAGYGDSLNDLRDTIHQVLDCGIVGINLQDSIVEGKGLRDVDDQCERIRAVRQTADEHHVHLVINARVDCFLSAPPSDRPAALEQAVARGRAYAQAGADCIYPIGPGDEQTVRTLRQRIGSPINIIGSPAAAPLSVLEQIGVNRVSLGPYVFRACLAKFRAIIEMLRGHGDYSCLDGMLSAAETGQYIRDRET